MTDAIRHFARDEIGATAIEYGLLAALIGVALIGGSITFSSGTKNIYDYLGNSVKNGLG